MNILVTGATGFLAQALLPRLKEKHAVYGLSRHGSNLIGDVTQHNLGLNEVPKVDALIHAAARLDLGQGEKSEVWETNVGGTRNVLTFCVEHGIPHLFFVSTAYTEGRNMYELSKRRCEEEIKLFSQVHELKTTIFKPSIMVADSKTLRTEGAKGMYHFAKIVARVHRRAELVRRKVEGTLRLPVLEPVFRVRGNPGGLINLVPVDAVAEAISSTTEEGVFWLTNPDPPTIGFTLEAIGEVLLLRIRAEQECFKPTPIEALFSKLAAPFLPYLQGDILPSDLPPCPVDKSFIRTTVERSLLGLG